MSTLFKVTDNFILFILDDNIIQVHHQLNASLFPGPIKVTQHWYWHQMSQYYYHKALKTICQHGIKFRSWVEG